MDSRMTQNFYVILFTVILIYPLFHLRAPALDACFHGLSLFCDFEVMLLIFFRLTAARSFWLIPRAWPPYLPLLFSWPS